MHATHNTAGMTREPGGAWLAAMAALALYFLTCAPDVLWGDSGTFQVRVARGELNSPAGLALAHPLYIALARGFALLPLGTIAYRVNLFSAVCAAAAVGLTFRFVARGTGDRFAAAIAAVALAVSHTFWTHAVTAEVYTLYVLLLAGELCCIERYVRTGRRRGLYLALLLNGLSLSNHVLAALHAPAYLVLMFRRLLRGGLRWRHVPSAALFWLSGAGLYVGMIAGQVAAGDSVAAAVREAFVGKSYQKNVGGGFSPASDAARTLMSFALNFPTPLALLLPLAWRRRSSTDSRADPINEETLAAAQASRRDLALFVALLFAVHFLFAATYTVPDKHVFFQACYVLLAIWLGGAAGAWARTPMRRRLCVAAALLPALVYEIAPPLLERWNVPLGGTRDIPGRSTYAYFLRPRKNGDDGARRFAEEAFATVGPDGYLMAGSPYQPVLAYVRDVEGIGRDTVMQTGGEVPPAPPTARATPRVVAEFARAGRAYVCDVRPGRISPEWAERYDFQAAGPVFRLTPKSGAEMD
ncbi:MAG: DUF2723 domain-containing protein [Phycisphaerae bacterium]|nr:DUF2723 domain-containing protein [Phycisphaerae bacterium]